MDMYTPNICITMGMVKGLIIIFSIFVSLMLIASPFGIVSLQFASAQASQVSSDVNNNNNNNNNNANSLDVQDIPLQKVHVGDIDVAYKMFGKGDPIIIFNGASENMNDWDPSVLKELASNHTVIVFDTRGIANSTLGSRSYSMQQLANDTAGLLDALKIPKADVMGYSLGSFIAQQLTITNPEKVNRLILVASTCGGNESIPKPAWFLKLNADIVNKTVNHIPPSYEEMKAFVVASVGENWARMHPESVKAMIPANLTSLEATGVGTSEVWDNQKNVSLAWEATNWTGACDDLAKIAKPTLVITGTDDNAYVPHENSLILAGKIPGAWLVQIPNAGHAVMVQYPDEISKILNTFLTTTAAQASNATSTATAAAAAGTNTTTTTTTTNTNTNSTTTTAGPTMNLTSTPSEAG